MTVRDGLSLHMPYELFAGPESEDLVSLVLFLAEFTLRTLLIYVLGTTLLFLSGCSNLGARRVLHPPGTHPYHYHYHRLTRPPSPNDSPLPDAAGPWDCTCCSWRGTCCWRTCRWRAAAYLARARRVC